MIKITVTRKTLSLAVALVLCGAPATFADEVLFSSSSGSLIRSNSSQAHFNPDRAQFNPNDVVMWQFGGSECQTCPVFFEPLAAPVKTKKVKEFLEALSQEKFQLIALYESDPQEYNLLAHMAVGILGRESSFFESWRYEVKESAQPVVTMVKAVRSYLSEGEWKPSRNSRGPTQIKIVPGRIREFYGIDEDDLNHPRAAAVATMGILIEALRELKQRALNRGWSHIQPETYVDYLPYIYFGGTRRLIDGTATPETNVYVREMKRYMMFVRVYEGFPVENFQIAP
jgi:hypothetical protein